MHYTDYPKAKIREQKKGEFASLPRSEMEALMRDAGEAAGAYIVDAYDYQNIPFAMATRRYHGGQWSYSVGFGELFPFPWLNGAK